MLTGESPQMADTVASAGIGQRLGIDEIIVPGDSADELRPGDQACECWQVSLRR